MADNPKDPLKRAGPDAARELFRRLSVDCNGFCRDDVLTAAANLIINGLRQQHGDRASAEREFDALFGRSKQVLVDHYDSLGRKRGIFPYDQHIHLPLVDPLTKRH